MRSFNVTAQSFVPGISIQTMNHANDGSWSLLVIRENFVPEEMLGLIVTVTLVPIEIIGPDKPLQRNSIAIPESCTEVLVFIGTGIIETDKSRDFLGMEVLSAGKSEDSASFRESLILGNL